MSANSSLYPHVVISHRSAYELKPTDTGTIWYSVLPNCPVLLRVQELLEILKTVPEKLRIRNKYLYLPIIPHIFLCRNTILIQLLCTGFLYRSILNAACSLQRLIWFVGGGSVNSCSVESEENISLSFFCQSADNGRVCVSVVPKKMSFLREEYLCPILSFQ